MYMTVQGIVLRITDYNDKDALLTLLTRHLALVEEKKHEAWLQALKEGV